MAFAAVPAYLKDKDLSQASPGLRFGMYLKLWGENRRSHELLWTTHDITHEVRGQNSQEREVKNENKVTALNEAKRLSTADIATMNAVCTRQNAAIRNSVPEARRLTFEALAIAPFTTGLGNEHPLENGFAFLNPYGLPYLAGSGVKGVLRQAARELAAGEWGECLGWNDAAITSLFGNEGLEEDSGHQRGAITFWDVIPQIKGDSLQVEIMTPHQSHYYQQKNDRKTGSSTSPHDSGQPTPISFLTVPTGSAFTFHVQCNPPLLQNTAPDLLENEKWKRLLTAAFEHAFAWCGFGAKTAVGYGAMADIQSIKLAEVEAAQAQKEAKSREYIENLKSAGITFGEFEWNDAVLHSSDPGQGNITVRNAKDELATGKLWNQLSDTAKKRFKNKKQVLLVATVEQQGNQIVIKSVTEKPSG
jgi:CRISPR-associated protein Cmr6